MSADKPAAGAPARAKKPNGKKSSPLDGIVSRLFSTQEWIASLDRRLSGNGPTELGHAQHALSALSQQASAFSHKLAELKKTGWAPPSGLSFTPGDKVALKPTRVQPFLKQDAYKAGDLINLTVVGVFGDRVKVKLASGEIFGLLPSFYFKRAPGAAK